MYLAYLFHKSSNKARKLSPLDKYVEKNMGVGVGSEVETLVAAGNPREIRVLSHQVPCATSAGAIQGHLQTKEIYHRQISYETEGDNTMSKSACKTETENMQNPDK
jgi:hypothetical protein